jgi:hypothetical protein
MRTSLTEIQHTEQFLLGKLDTAETLLFEAKMLTNDDLRTNTLVQRSILRLIRLFHRKQLSAQAAEAHNRLFSDPQQRALAEDIIRIFNTR